MMHNLQKNSRGYYNTPLLETSVNHVNIRVKQCAYGHSIATQLNPCGVTRVSHKYSLMVARHATVVVAVPSTVHCPAKYKVKVFYFR
jgi:hypothetical protein